MTSDAWHKLETAFARALSLQGEQREIFVAEFAAAEPALGAELRRLLSADGDADAELVDPIAATAASLARERGDPWVGRVIGAWTITRRLAGGGMGAVFLAERSDHQYEQAAALKVMAAQLVAPEAIGRFKSERQILANLNHPFIAKLIDGGSTDEGVPYLVMEYIDGMPIDQYCDGKRLRVAERVALFRKVCEAVDYAHRNLVVHRDLKPSNILVDAQGNPRLLDFGIAKLIEADSARHTVAMTREGTRVMTPEYASPEQVRGQPVSVATDVYSLGVLLFRLLTGQSPYGANPTTPLEIARAIVELDPRRPSTAVSLTGSDAQVGEHRRVSLDVLRRALLGDLDNIILKSLQKDPERRYPTAEALAADLRRYLANEPVQARGDDWLYKGRKFTIRHWRGVTMTTLALVGSAAIAGYYTKRLTDERDRANLAASQAAQVSGFLSRLFDSASAFASKGEAITAFDLLEQGSRDIEQLREQPQLQAELQRIMGTSYTSLGFTTRSTPMLEAALATKEAATPRDELSIAETLENLSEAYRQQGQLEPAESYLRRALAVREAELGENDALIAHTQARIGAVLHDRRDYDGALAIEKQALETFIALGLGEDPAAIDVRGNLCNSLDSLGRYDEAAAMFAETIALSRRIEGEMDPNTLIRMANYGLLMTRQGRLDEALQQFDVALERGRKVWPEDNDNLAFMASSRAAVLKRMGHMSDALAGYEEAARITRKGLGEHNARYSMRLRGLGTVLLDMGRYQQADAMLQRALQLAIELQGEDGPQAAQLWMFLGMSSREQQRPAQAEAYLRKSLAHANRMTKYNQLNARSTLAAAISAQGRYSEAEQLVQQLLGEMIAVNGENSPVNIPFLSMAGVHYRRAGNLQRALEMGERAYRLAEPEMAKARWVAALAVADYADTLREARRPNDAERLYREAHVVLVRTFGAKDPRTRRIAAQLGV
ncbi:MAG: tetratricopeptide repeat protein [Steroidobacteraceae bacterium]